MVSKSTSGMHLTEVPPLRCPLQVRASLLARTWPGLSAASVVPGPQHCLWTGHRAPCLVVIDDVIFLHDLANALGCSLRSWRDPRAISELFRFFRGRNQILVAMVRAAQDVSLTKADRTYLIEDRPAALVVVLTGADGLAGAGLYEYVGNGLWHTFTPDEVPTRIFVV